ncbi:acyl-CoA/acyl-ACP dehydrogenase [bacterium]|nr:acyl-CoA/acyl-ACP dehydrogenase [bacterium]
MDYALAKDQEMIKKSAKEFFQKECPKDKVRELKEDPKGYDQKIWKKMIKLGYQGLVIPEKYGGLEGEFLELMVFMEELGRNIMPSPFFSTVIDCVLPILEYGTEKQKETHLPGIAEQGDIWTLAQSEQTADYEADDIKLSATAKGNMFVLNGAKLFVPYASVAGNLLVVARTTTADNAEDGITLFLVDAKSPGISMESMPTAAHDNRSAVTFENVKVPAENILGEKDKGWEIVDNITQHSAVLKAAEMSGGAQAALDLVVNYTKERKQFSKSLGTFQAIQHRLVDLLTGVEGLKYLVHKAAWNINNGTPSKLLNSVVKAKANSVYHNVCYHGIVMHGAIGWTEEMDIGLYHIRTRSMNSDAGGTDFHLERIARELETRTPDFKTVFS